MTNPYDPAWSGTPAHDQAPPVPPADEPAPVTGAPVAPYPPAPYPPPPYQASAPPYPTPPYQAPAPPYQTQPPSYPTQAPAYQAPAAPWASPATPYEGRPPSPGMVQPPVAPTPPGYPYQQPPPYQAYPPAPPGYPPPYGQGYGPPVPVKKSRVGLIIGIVAVVVVLCLAVGGFFAVRFLRGVAAPTHIVVQVTGQGPAQVTIDIDSSTVEDSSRSLPYTYTMDLNRSANEVSVSARPVGPGTTVSCRILGNGVEKASQSGGTFARPAVCIAFV